GRPVLARPPSFGYLLGRLVRRNRALVFTAATSVLILITAAVVVALLALDHAEQRRLTELASQRAAANAALAERTDRMAARTRARGDLRAAEAAFDFGDASAVVRNLEAIPPELRGWEWSHLRA